MEINNSFKRAAKLVPSADAVPFLNKLTDVATSPQRGNRKKESKKCLLKSIAWACISCGGVAKRQISGGPGAGMFYLFVCGSVWGRGLILSYVRLSATSG